jgi:hypothetical protein
MVLDSLSEWRRATNNLVRFNIVDRVQQSQINFKWRRVDRRSLGHCQYELDSQFRIFSAEIQIGISDGLVHAQYNDASEVKHTILHEIGHALGLIEHSDHPSDIMYVPHQFGVYTLSPRDMETITWLYSLPLGFNYKSAAAKYNLKSGFTINDVIDRIEKRLKGDSQEDDEPMAETALKPALQQQPQGRSSVIHAASLDEQHQILSQMGQFYLKTQSIKIDPGTQKKLHQSLIKKHLPPQPPES